MGRWIHRGDMARNNDASRGKVETSISFVMWRVTEECLVERRANLWGGGCRESVNIA
jgi:hypothetical protein